jgi:Uma2 family endonuclease
MNLQEIGPIAMSSAAQITPQEPEYAWEVATLYPAQGYWSEEEYLHLTDSTKRRIELSGGRLEFLPMPTEIHDALSRYLFLALYEFVKRRQLGEVYGSGIRVRVRDKKVRLPDVVFFHKDHFDARHNRVWESADLAVEVVRDDSKDRDRDYQAKLLDYSEAGIAEYWTVDPNRQAGIIYRLDQRRYVQHGEFPVGQQATSHLLEGFSVDVTALFDSIKDIPE